MLIKRLTLACEVTFWIALAAAVGAPQISYAAKSTVSRSSVLAPIASVQALPGKVGALYAQKPHDSTSALEKLADRYETYTEFLHL